MDEITEQDLIDTELSFSLRLSPLKYVICDLSGILAGFVENLLSAFYPRIVSRRANIVITELVNNVLENVLFPESPLSVEVAVAQRELSIRICNQVTPDIFESVSEHVDLINSTEDLKALLKETIRKRRKQRLKGGLGLMRLVVENKFQIAVEYENELMTVETRLALGGLL